MDFGLIFFFSILLRFVKFCKALSFVSKTGVLPMVILSLGPKSIETESSSSSNEVIFFGTANVFLGLSILSCSIFKTDFIIEFRKPSFFNTDFLFGVFTMWELFLMFNEDLLLSSNLAWFHLSTKCLEISFTTGPINLVCTSCQGILKLLALGTLSTR